MQADNTNASGALTARGPRRRQDRMRPHPPSLFLHNSILTRAPFAWLAEAAGVVATKPALATALLTQRQEDAEDCVSAWEMPGVRCPAAADAHAASSTFLNSIVCGSYDAPLRFSSSVPAGPSVKSATPGRCGASASFILPNGKACRIAWDPRRTPCSAVYATFTHMDPLLSHTSACIAVPDDPLRATLYISFTQNRVLPSDPAASYTVLPAKLPP